MSDQVPGEASRLVSGGDGERPKPRLTEAQLLRIWRETEGAGAQGREVGRKPGLAEQTCSRGRRRSGGVGLAAAGRRRPLAREKVRLQPLGAARDLELAVMQARLAHPWGARG